MILNQQIKNVIKKAVAESERKRKEHGMIICKEKNKQPFIPEDKITVGSIKHIEYEKCPRDTTLIGRIHTHISPTQK